MEEFDETMDAAPATTAEAAEPEQKSRFALTKRARILLLGAGAVIAVAAAGGVYVMFTGPDSSGEAATPLPTPFATPGGQPTPPTTTAAPTVLPTQVDLNGRNPFVAPPAMRMQETPGAQTGSTATGPGTSPSPTATPTPTATPPTTTPAPVPGPQGPAGKDGKNATLSVTYTAWNNDTGQAAISVSTGATNDATYSVAEGDSFTSDATDLPAAWMKLVSVTPDREKVTVQLGDETYTLTKLQTRQFF